MSDLGTIADESAKEPKPPIIMAHSPWVGGPGTRTFRIVLLKWHDGEYSVHHQFKDDGSYATGSYNRDLITSYSEWITECKYLIKCKTLES